MPEGLGSRPRGRRQIALLAIVGVLLLAACDGNILPHPAGSAAPTAAVPTATPLPTVPPSEGPQVYRVRPGDTLSRIARRFRRTLGQILAANATIIDPNHIEIGQVITIPTANAPDIPPLLGSASDPSDDLVDETGAETSAPGYADLLGLALRLRDDDLLVELQLLTSPPAVDGSIEALVYTVNLDTTGDGEPDYVLTYANNAPGATGYEAALENRATGETLSGASYPGTARITPTAIDLTVPLAALDVAIGHASIAAAAAAARTFLPGGPTDPEREQSLDLAPDQQWPNNNPRWVTVGR